MVNSGYLLASQEMPVITVSATMRRQPAHLNLSGAGGLQWKVLGTFYILGPCVAPTTGPGVWQVLGK